MKQGRSSKNSRSVQGNVAFFVYVASSSSSNDDTFLFESINYRPGYAQR